MLIIVCFSVLKKSRIPIAILDFLSTLKRTSISAFVLLLFINGISSSSLSKTGHRKLRKSLYMPALVAIRYNPLLKAYYENLLARGKVKMVAVIAVMRKLLVICYGVLKSGQVFDVDYVKKKASLATCLMIYHHLTVIGASACAVKGLYHYLHKYFGVWGKAPIIKVNECCETL